MKRYEGSIDGKNGVRYVQVEAATITAAYRQVTALCGEGEFNRGVSPVEESDDE